MQKKLIALAVVAAMVPAAAMADTTVYGRIHVSYDGVSNSQVGAQVASSSSRFGVKGSEDLVDGMKAVYQLETGINAINNNPDGNPGGAGDGNPGGGRPGNTLFTGMRTSYLGLAGGYGTFLVGRLPSGEQYVYDSNLFADQIGDAANILANGGVGYIGGRANSTLHYITPNFSGFDAALTYLPPSSVDASAGASNIGAASYGVKLNYAAMGAAVHVTYFDVQLDNGVTKTDITPLSIAANYTFGPAMVTAQYVRNSIDATGASSIQQDMFNVGGSYKAMENVTLKAQYSKANDTDGLNDGGSQIAVGLDYDLSKRTGVYVAYSATSNNAGANFKTNNYGHGGNATVVGGQDPSALSVGLTHNF